jgi:hypothetical protein
MDTVTLKRTMIFLDPEDHRALFERALEESRQVGHRIGMAEIIRRAVKVYLQATPTLRQRKLRKR